MKKGAKLSNPTETAGTTTQTIVNVETVETLGTGIGLSGSLRNSDVRADCSIVLVIKPNGAPVVEMAGFWNGSLLKAALRAIQKQYGEARRHGAVWAMKKAQENQAA